MKTDSATLWISSRIFLLALMTLLLSCSGEPPALTIGEVQYTESDLLGFSGSRRTRLAEITALGLAVSRGEEAELGAPLVQRRSQVNLLEALEREASLLLAGVGEDQLEAQYRMSPDVELSVRHLVFLVPEWASEEEEGEARTQAETALERILGGEDFATVAGEVSEEPGAADRGGLLQPGRKGSWVDAFWNAANALDVGEVSPVVRSEYGFHVLKLESRTPLPFSESRFRVVEEVARLIPDQSAAIEAWMDSATVTLRVDSAGVREAFQEAGSLFTLAQQTLREGDARAPIATWEGGEFTRDQFRTFLLSLQRPSWEHVRSGGVEEILRVAREGARRSLLTQRAEAMGVTLPDTAVELYRREWDETVSGWAAGLGFRGGMSPEEVKEASLAALASSGQGASIVRQEIQSWAPLLLSAYPIGPEARGEG
jgi:hypothetical protein